MFSIGLIGGTGDLGSALAIHLSKKYETVAIGSRNIEKARESLKTIIEEKGARRYLLDHLKPASNREVVSSSDIVIVTIPHENAVNMIRDLATHFRGDQVLVSAVATLTKVGTQFFSGRGSESIAKQMKIVLPSGVQVASAFQTLPAAILYKERQISADVLVCAESSQTYEKVAQLVSSVDGLRPLYLGDLDLAGDLEGLTALILNIAIKNRLKSPTLKINSF